MSRWSRSIVPCSLLIWYVAVVHAYWALAIHLHPACLRTTSLWLIARTGNDHVWVITLLLLGPSVASVLPLCWRSVAPWHAVLNTPQVMLTMLSAFGGMLAAARGMYADGTIHDPLFILSDQMPVILLAGFHFVAVLLVHQSRARQTYLGDSLC